MPHYSRTISIVEQTVCVLVDLCAKLEAKKLRLAKELEELETFLDSVKDSIARQILRLRYIDLKSWRQISFEVCCGNGESTARMIHDRLFDKY